MNRYINIFSISIFNCTLTISIGNPMWFINEYKKIKRGDYNAQSCEKCTKV